MHERPIQPRIPHTGPRRFAVDAVALLLYLIVVYAASLWVRPLGRDYAALADPGSLPPIAGRLFAWEIAAFGGWAPGYHVVNLVILYGCMLALYRFVRLTIPGPFWLGTLAAALFMANPVHSEAVLNLSGVADLVPAFFALLALAVYARHVVNARWWTGPVTLAAFAMAVLPYARNFPLIIVAAAYQWAAWRQKKLNVCPSNEGTPPAACSLRWRCPLCPTLLVPMATVTALAAYLHPGLFRVENIEPAGMFAPLYLIFYPIGLLPETAYAFYQHPWLGWLAAAAVLFVIALVYRKARQPVIAFGLVSMAGMRLFQGGEFFDPVHMLGGGRLLVPNALFCVALVGLFYRITDHPKWRRPVIMMTTLLAVVFFAMQIMFIVRWREASRLVEQFQAAASVHAAPVGILPDYRAYLGAPVGLSEAISHDTPFSKRVDHVSLLPLDYAPPEEHFVQVKNPEVASLTCLVEAEPLVKIIPWPFGLMNPGNILRTEKAVVEVYEVDGDSAVFMIKPEIFPRELCCVRGITLPAMPESESAPPAAPAGGETEGETSQKGADMNSAEDDCRLTPEQRQVLLEAGWQEHAGDGPAVWVSISEQTFRIIEHGEVTWQAPCSTAKNGPGFKADSFKTPLGWHSVAEKVGEDAPWGQVFRAKRPTGEIWKPGEETDRDLVLTRILALAGEEPGLNKGGDVDSYKRCIYIHGTNGEDEIGRPVSHGCIRLKNDDVIEAFEKIPEGAAVLITE